MPLSHRSVTVSYPMSATKADDATAKKLGQAALDKVIRKAPNTATFRWEINQIRHARVRRAPGPGGGNDPGGAFLILHPHHPVVGVEAASSTTTWSTSIRSSHSRSPTTVWLPTRCSGSPWTSRRA